MGGSNLHFAGESTKALRVVEISSHVRKWEFPGFTKCVVLTDMATDWNPETGVWKSTSALNRHGLYCFERMFNHDCFYCWFADVKAAAGDVETPSPLWIFGYGDN